MRILFCLFGFIALVNQSSATEQEYSNIYPGNLPSEAEASLSLAQEHPIATLSASQENFAYQPDLLNFQLPQNPLILPPPNSEQINKALQDAKLNNFTDTTPIVWRELNSTVLFTQIPGPITHPNLRIKRAYIQSTAADSIAIILAQLQIPTNSTLLLKSPFAPSLIQTLVGSTLRFDEIQSLTFPGDVIFLDWIYTDANNNDNELQFIVKTILHSQQTPSSAAQTRAYEYADQENVATLISSCPQTLSVCDADPLHAQIASASAQYYSVGRNCNGNIIKSPNDDSKRIFVTADHCVYPLTIGDYSPVSFRWNNNATACAGSSVQMTTSGARVVARAENNTEDIAIFFLTQDPPTNTRYLGLHLEPVSYGTSLYALGALRTSGTSAVTIIGNTEISRTRYTLDAKGMIDLAGGVVNIDECGAVPTADCTFGRAVVLAGQPRHGLSGGGYYLLQDDQPLQYGVFSASAPCAASSILPSASIAGTVTFDLIAKKFNRDLLSRRAIVLGDQYHQSCIAPYLSATSDTSARPNWCTQADGSMLNAQYHIADALAVINLATQTKNSSVAFYAYPDLDTTINTHILDANQDLSASPQTAQISIPFAQTITTSQTLVMSLFNHGFDIASSSLIIRTDLLTDLRYSLIRQTNSPHAVYSFSWQKPSAASTVHFVNDGTTLASHASALHATITIEHATGGLSVIGQESSDAITFIVQPTPDKQRIHGCNAYIATGKTDPRKETSVDLTLLLLLIIASLNKLNKLNKPKPTGLEAKSKLQTLHS